MAVELRITLTEMGHPQPKTPVELDNATAFGMLTKQLVPKRSKAIDMRFSGFEIGLINNNFICIGTKVTTTWQITSPNSIRHNTIKI